MYTDNVWMSHRTVHTNTDFLKNIDIVFKPQTYIQNVW